MKNSLLLVGCFIFLSSVISCGNNNSNNNDDAGHAHDSGDVMYDDGRSMYDTLNRDSLSTDSLIPPTPPMN